LSTEWIPFAELAASVVTASAAVTATFIGLRQFRQARQLEFEDKRAFIVPRLTINKEDEFPRVYLVIRNAGDMPAKNVILDFEVNQVWHWVKPANFPFLREFGGITVIAPGDEMSYFVGEIRMDNTLFNDITNRDVTGIGSFDHPIFKGERVADDFRLSLSDQRYKSNPKGS
jgi:hypothetical protein